VKAWVLKPAMIGICRTLEVARAAAKKDILPVMSSAFESGVHYLRYFDMQRFTFPYFVYASHFFLVVDFDCLNVTRWR
jgi:hypothetical protein